MCRASPDKWTVCVVCKARIPMHEDYPNLEVNKLCTECYSDGTAEWAYNHPAYDLLDAKLEFLSAHEQAAAEAGVFSVTPWL